LLARKPVRIFLAVEKALFLRELGMRITTSKSGLFWTFFEPFMQVLIFTLIHAVAFDVKSSYDYAIFTAVNFTAYSLFKNIVLKSMTAFSANKALFIYKQVKPVDTVIARAMVELFITGVVILIFVLIGLYFGYDLTVKNFPMVMLGLFWIMLFSISLGILLAVGNMFYPSIGRIIGIGMMFLMFGSAVFYSLERIPPQIAKLLLYNPVTHFMEMIHGWYFYELDDRFVNYSYMAIWTMATLFFGLWLYRHLEKKIISS
jgi:capsular polysaccharide transport system permease protein